VLLCHQNAGVAVERIHGGCWPAWLSSCAHVSVWARLVGKRSSRRKLPRRQRSGRGSTVPLLA